MTISSAQLIGRVFVVGMPRSGTKLFRDMIGQHSSIRALDVETEFLPMLVARLSGFGDLSQHRQFMCFFDSIKSLPYFVYRREQGHVIDPSEWFAACERHDAAGIFDALMRVEVAPPQGGLWLDKSPSYIGHLELLTNLYVDAKVVHIVRDVRDHCLSMKKAWGKSMLRAAQRWRDDVGAALDVSHRLTGKVLLVRYEDLLRDPDSSMRRVSEFLGIEFEPEMCGPGRVTENLGSAAGKKELARDNAGSYLRKMHPQDRASIEAVAGDVMDRLGYIRERPGCPVVVLPAWRLTILRLYDAVRLLQFEIRERGFVKGLLFRFHYAMSTGNRFR